jgi:energy-coupling factor transporter ATP-binding protein EcfA2
MDEKITEAIVTAFVKELTSKGAILFKEASSELNNFFKIGISKYLKKQVKKYSTIKTLLRGNTPANLYDIYFPLKIKSEKQKAIETSAIESVFAKSKYITIIGDAGSGKSTLIKHLFINSIRTNFAIPLLIELRNLNDYRGDLKSYILEKILENKIQSNERIIERILEAGEFVFFLDGYDELSSTVKQSTISCINSLVDQYTECKFILTSRPYSDVENFQRFHNYRIMELTIEGGEIIGFVNKQLSNELELAQKINKSIESSKSEHIKSFLTNPLLLSLYILTFQNDASVPDKKCIFYRRVINSLFFEHDSKKLGYEREKLSGLNQEQFEELQKKFCFISYFESKFSWDADYINAKFSLIKSKVLFKFDNLKVLKDLKSAIALWIEDNGKYGFAHRSLQEYFAALLISNLDIPEKTRAYTKISERLPQNEHTTETQNLLSLLEEMDYIYYLKFYKIPQLRFLRAEIKNGSADEIIKSVLVFFCEAFLFIGDNEGKGAHRRNRQILVKSTVYHGIYIHIKYTRPIHDAILEGLIGTLQSNISKFTQLKKSENQILVSIPEHLDDALFQRIRPHLSEPAMQFNAYIDRELESMESFLRTKERNDSDLVDLI